MERIQYYIDWARSYYARRSRLVHFVAGIFLLLLFVVSRCGGDSGERYRERMGRRGKAINFVITNEMSDLEATERFDRDIETFMRYWRIRGASFALMRNDKLIYAKGYGYADEEQQIPCDVKHTFRMASASKLITASAIMKLCEKGRLKLSDQVFGEKGILNDPQFQQTKSKYIEDITVEHLMRHRAGFANPIGDPAFNNEGVARALDKELPLSLDDMVTYASHLLLKFRPGSSYDYSNIGYIVLEKIVEVVSGRDYEEFVRSELLEPAGCHDIYIGSNFPEDRDNNEVAYYEVAEAEPVEACDGSGRMVMKSRGGNNISLLGGAGGWVASPVEMLKFVASINNNKGHRDVLSKKSIEQMTHNSLKYKPMGWATVTSSEWLRSGSMSGTFAYIKRRADGYTWIFLSNTSTWVGHNMSTKTNAAVTAAMSRVSEWPDRDLFDVR